MDSREESNNLGREAGTVHSKRMLKDPLARMKNLFFRNVGGQRANSKAVGKNRRSGVSSRRGRSQSGGRNGR